MKVLEAYQHWFLSNASGLSNVAHRHKLWTVKNETKIAESNRKRKISMTDTVISSDGFNIQTKKKKERKKKRAWGLKKQ